MSIFEFFVNWPMVLERISAIAEDQKKLDSFIEDRFRELIQQEHPNDYEEYVKEHSAELEAIKRRISDKYGNSLKRYVEAIKERKSEST